MKKHIVLFCFIFFCAQAFTYSAEPNPTELLEQMDQLIRGKSHDMTVTLDVKAKRWERHYKIRVQMKALDYAIARVLEPPKVEGQGFLRIQTRLWNYLPSAERTILIQPSLMLDKFLGSDFSNDDFVKMSYFAHDYTAKIVKQGTVDGFPSYNLELTPKPDSPVTYGKLEVTIREKDAAPLVWKFYNEKLEHIRTLYYSGFKTFGDREIPTVWQMENLKEKDRQTTITILDAKYNLEIQDSEFTRQQLEKYP